MVCSLFNYGVGVGIADVEIVIPASSYSPYVNIGDLYQFEGGVACAESFYYSINELASTIVYVTSADGLSYTDFRFSSFPYKTVVHTSTLTLNGQEYPFTGAEVLGVTAASGSGSVANLALTATDSSLGSILVSSQATASLESISESLSNSVSTFSNSQIISSIPTSQLLQTSSDLQNSDSSSSEGKSTSKKSSIVSTTTGSSASESVTNTKASSSGISSTQSNVGIYKIVPTTPLVLVAALMLL